ncbi:MAG: FKBP-type peptidyl-prolyl cis-trans isomerase, partial [Elusimicrobiaceae bacterium]|nr:FKBP-type peptidyl-prolyl cis-trans isomerase [Elusimicrobiaceae bacterium]
EYKPQIIAKYQKDAEIISQRRLQEQKEYLENFSKEKGVKVLDNGAMIKLSKKGKGRTAKADSKVRVHYTGKLIDGTKFDSSYDREEPFTTRLTDVVPCWTKALQQMRPASKAVVVCPAETAYGNRPVGIIPAGSALIFDVELLSIED